MLWLEWWKKPLNLIGGAKEDRTPDLLRARQALSQLSYGPKYNIDFRSLPEGKLNQYIFVQGKAEASEAYI